MQYDTQSGRHSKYSLQYHLIFCTKYRKNMLNNEISNKLKEQIDKIAKKKDIEILNKETSKDHIHILFRAKPTTNLSKTINAIKGVTSRVLRKEFPELKKEADSLWAPTYFLATTGEVTLNQLKEYVEAQG
ncbi:MAG: REP element-mobilizing transposase RayT [Candidatus Methanohalarchaeum thermophilum]|uniref:REP element-mobilizing transposase RayT n=1 Tax=Methanohalarchaeum thermophilum TaxID=1903181 RepID=A0A1Q6DUG2_METT1|nr:MAG: REP element-mobilizing transposase RayT [Candidatus Methanohalarchaeum thermophilum]